MIDEPINVKMIEEYCYCPLKIYYKYVLGIPSRETLLMRTGKEFHEGVQAKEKRRRTLLRFRKLKIMRKWHYLYVCSKELSLQGCIDIVAQLDDGKYTVVEIKLSETSHKVPPGYKYQLVAYAMLAEKRFKVTIRKGYILSLIHI